MANMGLDNLENMQTFMKQVLSAKADVRVPAEQQLDKLFDDRNTREVVVTTMSRLITTTTDDAVRQICALVLHRRLNRGEPTIFEKLSDQTQNVYKQTLLESLLKEPSASIRLSIADSFVETALVTLCRGKWDEALPFLKQMSHHQDAKIRQSAIYIYGALCDEAYSFMEDYMRELCQIYEGGLRDSAMNVRVATLQAMARHLSALSEELAKNFIGLLPLVLEATTDAMHTDDEKTQSEALQPLVQFVEEQPRLIGHKLDEFIRLMAQIGSSEKLSEDVRLFALEFLVSFAENDEVAARKSDFFVTQAYELALKQMLAIEDDLEEWANTEDDFAEGALFGNAEQSCDRLGQAIGPGKTLPCMFPLVERFLTSQQWQYRFVALRALAQVAELADLDILPKLVEIPLRHFADPDPRVCYAAIHCIGQMSTDFAPDIQRNHHATIMPAIIAVLKNTHQPVPKIQSHAASALVNFAEFVTHEIVAPYADDLLNAVHKLLRDGAFQVQENVATAIASLADSSAAVLVPHLKIFLLTLLEMVVKNMGDDKTIPLATKALECITFIGLGLDKLDIKVPDLFRNVGHQLMEITTKHIEPDKHPEWYQYSTAAWVRIAQVLGADFDRYLPVVMPAIFKSSSLACNVESPHDEADEDGFHSEEVEEKKYGLSALQSLVKCFADAQSNTFLPHLETTFKIFLENTAFGVDAFRHSSLMGLRDCMRCAMLGARANKLSRDVVVNLFKMTIQKFTDLLLHEYEQSTRLVGLENLYTIINESGECASIHFSQPEHTKAVMQLVIKMHDKSLIRRNNIHESNKENEGDEESVKRAATLLIYEDMLDVRLSKTIEALIRAAKDNFAPVYQAIAPQMLKLLQSDESHVFQKQFPLNFFADCIEIIPQVGPVRESFDVIVPIMLRLSSDKDPRVKQSAVFALGSSSKALPQQFSKYSKPSLEALVTACEQHKSDNSEHFAVYDNAVGAIAKLLAYHADSIDTSQVFPILLQMLPLSKDIVEAQDVNRFLVEVLERSDQPQSKRMLGDNLQHVPRVLQILAGDLGTDNIEDESLQERVVQIFKSVSSLPGEIQRSVVNALSPEVTQKLQRLGV